MTTQDQLDRIIGFDSGGLPVVSVYVRVAPDDALSGATDVQTRVNSLLDPIRGAGLTAWLFITLAVGQAAGSALLGTVLG